MTPSTLPMFGPPDMVTVTNPTPPPEQNKPTLKAFTAALAASQLVPLARRLFSVTVTNTGAVNQFLQIFDSATLPADTAVPLVSVPVSAGQVQFYDLALGLPLINGLAVCISTTQATKTLGAVDSLFVSAYNL